MILTIRNLKKKYDKNVINNFSYSFSSGNIYGIKGKKNRIGTFNALFILPAILKFAELIITMHSIFTMGKESFVNPGNLFELIFSFVAFIFLGLFYLEDSRCIPE